jgi:hypothetical protein
MKMTSQIIITIGLIILGIIATLIYKKRSDLKDNDKRIENKVLVIDGKPILKQFGDLTISDFDKYPIWVQCHIIDYEEQWYDSTDEETFRPWIDKFPVSPDFAMFLLKAELKLKNGEVFPGFITPCLKSVYKNENDLGLIQPQIFTKKGERIGFWTGMFPIDKVQIDSFYELLNNEPDKIFPIDFKAIDGLSIGVTSGKINGFLTKGKDNEVIITK